jgi:outer membrane receptor for ferrienterochelin and colicin
LPLSPYYEALPHGGRREEPAGPGVRSVRSLPTNEAREILPLGITSVKYFIGFVAPFSLLAPLISLAGTDGILEGTTKNKKTGEPLLGVNVLIVGLQRGSATDTTGAFVIQNIRAGKYDVRFTHVGFQSFLAKGVLISPDLKTKLTIALTPADVELGEITVVQERPPIERDVTGTTFLVTGEELTMLPLDNVADVLHTRAGVTLEGNVRGGKATEVQYLVDGLPVQDVLAGGLSANLPNSSISGLSIFTGGFEPEYGNALSGVVNIVTRTGSNEHQLFVRADKDNLFGGSQVSAATDAELSLSGPIQKDKIFYLASMGGAFTHTRWWQDFQYYFDGPIEQNVNAFGKIDYLFTPTLRLGAQLLYSGHNWRDYEFNWRFNLKGLPAERRIAYRLAAIISHSVSESFFYTASLSRYNLVSAIGLGSKDEIPVNDPYQYDFLLQYAVSGQRAWWTRSRQETYTTKFDGTWRANKEHLIKFGGELNLYDLHSDVVKFEPRKTYFGKPLINEPQLNYSSSYAYYPHSGSVYLQDKIDTRDEGILLNVGLRYDFLNPTANRPAIEAIPVRDTSLSYIFHVQNTVRAHLKQQFSPRFGAAMQVAENGFLFVNLGWYFQFPLFDYMYGGLDRVTLAKGISAITGNPDLEPERTMSWEISLKYALPAHIVASATYFHKETTYLVDTKTFIPGDSKLAGTYGFAEYVNNPFGEASGLEIVVSRQRGDWLTGELSYTYMATEGTSGSAQDGFYIAQYGLPPAVRVYPLSWDQRHTVKMISSFKTPWDLNCNFVVEYHSGRPYTNYPTSTGFEPIIGGLFIQNNERMPSYFSADVKVEKYFELAWWPQAKLKAYCDIRNLFSTRNVKWVDSNGMIGGELHDPSGYYIGRRTRVGVQIEL